MGSYTFTAEPGEVVNRLNASRDHIRNTYGQREFLFRGNTYPGLPFASPDGVSTYLKVREVLNRLYALRPHHRDLDHVLMGVGWTLAMHAAFPKNTMFCDVEAPKHVAKHVPVVIANALSMRCEDGSMLNIEGKVYISDVYGGPTKPSEHYRQIDAIIAGRPACGAIKCFLDNPRVIGEAARKLSRNYSKVFYCGVTKAHTGEFFMCFGDIKPHEADLNRGTDVQCLVFLALHSVRTDLANYFYSGHVRAGVLDFSKFRRIDAVIQRHGGRLVGKAWARTVSVAEIQHVTGKKERAGTVAPTESMSLADLEALEQAAEDEALLSAVSEGDAEALAPATGTSGATPVAAAPPVRAADRGSAGGEKRPPGVLEGEEEAPDPTYGTEKYKGKGKPRKKGH